KMRLNCVLVEDSIETDGLQRNSGNTDRDSPWFGKGNPIRHYVQRNVARINLAGNWGENGLLPQKMTTGETIEKSWFYTLPPDWNAEHMRILAFVTVWNNSGDLVDTSFFTVLNTEMNALQTGTSLPQAVKRTSSAFTSLAPNPFSASCCITFIHAKQGHAQVSILSLQGKTIATLTNEVVPEGENRVYWNGLSDTGISMPQGMYRVQLLTEDGSDSRPVILVR
ncbi:MAG TPA: Omp28-related outer membrane protein, partial [Bacteroidia bacterium]|nr:Omp28-related outer membrane protein [Bacteroidia bacterium]